MSSYLVASPAELGGGRSVDIDLDRFPMDALLEGCVENLVATYSERDGLFPYSTTLVGGRLVNVYDHPQAVRYTINTLLGLAEAARHGVEGIEVADVHSMTARLLGTPGRLQSPADVGLLALHLAENGEETDSLGEMVERLDKALRHDPHARNLDLQTLSWIAWGMVRAADRGVTGAEHLARRTADMVDQRFVEAGSILPRHSTRWYRRSIVSFGSVTYFLRAASELATAFDDAVWRDRFRAGVAWALEHQGPLGEWPWLMDTRSGTPIDVYPVFSVHQDSMSMLFLLPALEYGMSETAAAIERSLAWGFGANELGAGFYLSDPFLAHRSIERVESRPRLRRYLRSLAPRHRKASFGTGRARVNAECRSYHLGWVLYAWSGRVTRRATETPA